MSIIVKEMGKPYLSVVIPAYNEAKNIRAGVLDRVYDYLKKQKYSWEVLIVDDKSKDDTLKLVRKFAQSRKNFKVLAEPHRGKGATVIAGMLTAGGEIVLFADMDQATPLSEIEKFFPRFEKGDSVVIGSRSGRKGAPLVRKIMAYGFSILRLLILRLPYRDTQCGFKAFTSDAVKKIFGRMRVFNERTTTARGASLNSGFDLELLYVARKQGLRIGEIPVTWHHEEGAHGKNPIRDSWEGLWDLMRVRINAISGKYKV